MVDTRVQFWDKESGKGSMISFIFLFVLFKVLVLCEFPLGWHKETV